MPSELLKMFNTDEDQPIMTYFREVEKIEKLSAEEERALALAVREGDTEARNKLARSQLMNVVFRTNDFYKKNKILSFKDLLCEGNIAVLYAIEHFDPDKGRLSTYVSECVENAFKEAVRDEFQSIYSNVDEDRFERLRKELKAKIREDRGEEAPDPFIWLDAVLSINQRLTKESEETLGDILEGSSPNPEETVVNKDLEEKVLSILATYKEEDREIVYRYFGLAGHRKYSIDDLHELYGKTREEVKAVLSKVIHKLRSDVRFDDLQEYLN